MMPFSLILLVFINRASCSLVQALLLHKSENIFTFFSSCFACAFSAHWVCKTFNSDFGNLGSTIPIDLRKFLAAPLAFPATALSLSILLYSVSLLIVLERYSL